MELYNKDSLWTIKDRIFAIAFYAIMMIMLKLFAKNITSELWGYLVLISSLTAYSIASLGAHRRELKKLMNKIEKLENE